MTLTSSQKIGYNILDIRDKTYLLKTRGQVFHVPDGHCGIGWEIDLSLRGEKSPHLSLGAALGAEAGGQHHLGGMHDLHRRVRAHIE
jgi:hypothetical protein